MVELSQLWLPILLTAVAVWPPWLAFLLNWCGAVGAGVVGFAFARTVGRDWVARRLPARLAGLDDRIQKRGLATVKKNYARSVSRGSITQTQMDERLAQLVEAASEQKAQSRAVG